MHVRPVCHHSRGGPHLSCLLLKLLDGALVDSSALVDEVAGGGGLARVHVADDHNIDVDLLLPHVGSSQRAGALKQCTAERNRVWQ